VAHPARLEILEQLAQGERNVDVLADRIRVSIASASQHLQQMRRTGIITARREGRFVFYRLADDAVLDLIASVRRLAERHLSEVERVVRNYFDDRDSLEPVSRQELMDRLKAGLVTVLDVRPADEFALGHVPGAINVPLSELERRLADFDPKREIVAYCRGPYCVLSYEALPRCAPMASKFAGWRTDCRNGERRVCLSRSAHQGNVSQIATMRGTTDPSRLLAVRGPRR
jgi:ArsR family transcriptional regulator